MTYKQYTSCVQPNQYQNPDFTWETGLALFGLIAGGGPGGLPIALTAAMEAADKALEYMLNGKLVCLGGDVCAVGTIVDFETVADKSGFDTIDNDFSINIMLYPSRLQDFLLDKNLTADEVKTALDHQFTEAVGEVQGRLIAERPGMRLPRTPVDAKLYDPYRRDVTGEHSKAIGGVDLGEGETVSVLVFHAECEGSRIYDVLNALRSLGPPEWLCKFNPFGIPIGKKACAIVRAALLPILLALMIRAWYGARDGNPDDARLDPEAGALEIGNMVVINGRWVYDAGHSGWNEAHAVKSIQKIPYHLQPMVDRGVQQQIVDRWCRLTGEAPNPPAPHQPAGAQPAGMTAEQEAVWDAQQRPENGWLVHPALDGCEPAGETIR